MEIPENPKPVEEVTAAWECDYADYDSIPIYDDDDEISDSIGIVVDCLKEESPFCQFCPRNKHNAR